MNKQALDWMRAQPSRTKDAPISRDIEGLRPEIDVVGIDATGASGSVCSFPLFASMEGFEVIVTVIDGAIMVWFHENSE